MRDKIEAAQALETMIVKFGIVAVLEILANVLRTMADDDEYDSTAHGLDLLASDASERLEG